MNKKALITVIVSALFAAGFYYVYHYTAVFKNEDTYYSSFSKISGLQESGPVLIHGVKVGKIAEIKIGADKNILITYALKKNLKIPRGTFAKIINGDVSGTKAVKLHLGTQTEIIPVKGNIPTVSDTTIMELFNAKITPMVKGGKFLLRTVDSSLYDMNYLIRYGGLGKNVQQEMKAFRQDFDEIAQTSKNLSLQADKWSESIRLLHQSLPPAPALHSDIDQFLASGSTTTESLSRHDYDSLLKRTASSLTRLASSIKKISKEHTLFHDTSAYKEANRKIITADTAMQELMTDPPGIRLIGGGKNKEKK